MPGWNEKYNKMPVLQTISSQKIGKAVISASKLVRAKCAPICIFWTDVVFPSVWEFAVSFLSSHCENGLGFLVSGTVKVISTTCLCLLCKDIQLLLCFIISMMLLLLVTAYEPARWINEVHVLCGCHLPLVYSLLLSGFIHLALLTILRFISHSAASTCSQTHISFLMFQLGLAAIITPISNSDIIPAVYGPSL